MLEIYPLWFSVLLLNFLGLLYILNLILFRPFLKLFQQREESTVGALKAAQEMGVKREETLASVTRELQQARGKAKEAFEAVRREGLAKQKAVLDGANQQAQAYIEKAKTELKAETEKARQQLRADAERFSDEIVKKMVGA